MNLITIKAFDESMQAHLVKSKLESEGIDCWLIDEQVSNLYGHALEALNYKFGNQI